MDKTERERLLKQRINETLYYPWNPIGVSSMGPEARDEYDSYSDQVWRMVLDAKSRSEISGYLSGVVTNRIELTPNKKTNDEVAELALDWHEYLKHGLDR